MNAKIGKFAGLAFRGTERKKHYSSIHAELLKRTGG